MTDSRPAARPDPIPLTVLTGFLGSGKTTLLNRLLKDPALSDTVAIINEFGEVGIDHLLVENVEDGLVLLSAGCLCCTVRGDLVATLEDLLRRRDNGRISPFRRVIIETTGLADPAPVLAAVLYHPYLSMRYAIDAVVTVVDAATGSASLDRHKEALRQAAVADRLILTKSDLAEAGEIAVLSARLRKLNPAAEIIPVLNGEIAAGRIIAETSFDLEAKDSEVSSWIKAEAYECGTTHSGHRHHHHDHGHAHGHPRAHAHDVNRHDADIASFVLTSERPMAPGALDMFLDLVRSTFGPKILRIKGLVEMADNPGRPIVIHGVQHVLHVPAMLNGWPDDDRRNRIVFIVDGVPEGTVRRIWDAFTGRSGIDGPDAVALSDNPLAPATLAAPR